MRPTLCSFPGCGRMIKACGLCQGHYNQLRCGVALKPLRGFRAASKREREIAELEGMVETRHNAALKAQECYQGAVGIENRLKWRKTLTALQNECDCYRERLERMRAKCTS